MIDISKAIVIKSDQLNADDLVGEERVLSITNVTVSAGEQPVSLHYDGGDGKPYKPCLSMLKLLKFAWGKNGEDYIGRKMVVYNDPSVKWGGKAVGGIRISKLSDIDGPLTISMAVTRGKKLPYTVQPYTEPAPAPELSSDELSGWTMQIDAADTIDVLGKIADSLKAMGYANGPVKDELMKIFSEKKKELSA